MKGRLLVVLAAAALLAGCVAPQQAIRAGLGLADGELVCADLSAATSRSGQFQYGGAVSCKTAEESHDFTNPSPYAQVQWGGTVVEGNLTVRILDAAGREVYQTTLGPSMGAEAAQGATEIGVPSHPGGRWSIELTFEGFTGTMGLQVQSSMGQAQSLSLPQARHT